ncbi:MAG: hypothetical protein AB7O92_23555 [Acidimicrobiia bacterium]
MSQLSIPRVHGISARGALAGSAAVAVAGVVAYEPRLGALAAALSLWAIVVAVITARVRVHDGAHVVSLIHNAAIAKVVTSGLLLALLAVAYRGGDALHYHGSGTHIAAQIRAGLPVTTVYPAPGTGTVELMTGWLYLAIAPVQYAGYLVYSCGGFVGGYCWYRAVRMMEPSVDPRRLALLLFFAPSFLVWTSPISKDAVIFLYFGVAAIGMAHLACGRLRGVAHVAAGLGLTATIRPHLSVMFAAALAVALVAGRAPQRRVARPRLGARVLAGILAVAVGYLALQNLVANSSIAQGKSVAEVSQTLADVGTASQTGGTAFEAEPVTSLGALPQALLTVLYRPLLFEARSPLVLVCALESALLLGGLVIVPALGGALRWRALLHPLGLFGLTLMIMFAVGFANFGNFGYLVRQRTQLLPVLIAVPLMLRAAASREEA